MRNINLFILFSIMTFMVSNSAKSQDNYSLAQSWNVNLGLGYSKFFGDLTDKHNRLNRNSPFHKYFYQNKPLMNSLQLGKDINPYWGIIGQIVYGKLKSQQDASQLYFIAELYEYTTSVRFNLSNIAFGENRNRKFTSYAKIGIGLSSFHSFQYSLEDHNLLRSIGTYKNGVANSKFGTTETAIPMSIAFKYKLTNNVSAHIETGIHFINTDKLDIIYSKDIKQEGYAYTFLALDYKFEVKSFHKRTSSKFGGKSTDASIQTFKKRKRVVMRTKMHKRAAKRRYYKGSKRKKGIFSRKRKVKFG